MESDNNPHDGGMYVKGNLMKKIASFLTLGLLILSACGSAPVAQAGLETVVAATLDGLTAEAESSGLPVSYENISFRIPPALNASVNAFTDTQWEFPSINPSNGPMPAHAIFEFTNYPVESSYPAHEGARIMVFKSSEYAAYGFTEQEAVTALLAGQESSQPIPEALVMGMFYAQEKTVDFQNGHGVRYLTQVLDGVAPISNERIFYYYQGVTNDGAYFVSAIFHVNAAFLVADGDKDSLTPPDGVPFTWDQEVDFTKYRDEITQKLNATPDENFTPSLAVFDQLIGSMEIVSP
jgi:hypothetical protein